MATVDAARGEVLEVADYGIVPIPTETGSYLPEDHQPPRAGLRPLEIHQPEGPSFTVEGNEIHWMGWSMRVSMDPNDGLVLHCVTIEDKGRKRTVLHRASITEMVVPYGDPGPVHGWKNAFDAGEWGLGRMVNSLELGCDCLGAIHYLDATFATERGDPYVVRNAICIHEEDYGILWKHQDMHSGRTEVRRSRRLVVSFIATVGNYEYGFYWYFYLDGTIQLEVKLTGVMQTQALSPGELSPYAPPIAPGLAAPVHQHLFCARLDFELDGKVNEAHEVEAHPVPPGGREPVGQRLRGREPTPRLRAGGPSHGGRDHQPNLEIREPLGREPARPTRRLQARHLARPRSCWPPPNPVSRGGPVSLATTSGSRPMCPTNGEGPATTRTSTPVVTGSPSGRPPIAHWSAPTSWPGIPSVSPTSPDPRTGRSCPSSPAGSTSSPRGSSTPIRPSTSRRPMEITRP